MKRLPGKIYTFWRSDSYRINQHSNFINNNLYIVSTFTAVTIYFNIKKKDLMQTALKRIRNATSRPPGCRGYKFYTKTLKHMVADPDTGFDKAGELY